MGIFGVLGNIASGWQGARLGKKQMGLGQEMIDEAQKISADNPRPEMMTPDAINMMVAMAQGRQFQNMPGYDMAQNQLGEATASGMSAINNMASGAEGIGALANLYANQMGEGRNLAISNAEFQSNAQKDYMGALGDLGNWQQQAWQWNEADPYLQAQQKAAQLEQMGRQGQWEGMKTKMGSWANSFQGIGSALDEGVTSLLSSGLLKGIGGSGSIGNMTSSMSPIMPKNVGNGIMSPDQLTIPYFPQSYNYPSW